MAERNIPCNDASENPLEQIRQKALTVQTHARTVRAITLAMMNAQDELGPEPDAAKLDVLDRIAALCNVVLDIAKQAGDVGEEIEIAAGVLDRSAAA